MPLLFTKAASNLIWSAITAQQFRCAVGPARRVIKGDRFNSLRVPGLHGKERGARAAGGAVHVHGEVAPSASGGRAAGPAAGSAAADRR